MKKPILISLSPNAQKDDVILALKLIFQPWKWKNNRKSTIVENPLSLLEEKFKEYLPIKHGFTFNSGRSAFFGILKSLDIEQGEVLLQAFTCSAAVNPIVKAGFKPVFVDIDKNTLNIDTTDLEAKISNRSRIVLVQHTFGQPADLEQILTLCQKYSLILIEDCAHSLGASYYNQKLGLPTDSASAKVGTFAKAAFFSFGRDKVISSVFGGMAVTDDDELAKKLEEYQASLNYPTRLWTCQQLLHPILNKFFVIPFYGFFGIGKWILILLQKLNFLSKAVKDKEKQGLMPDNLIKRMPDKLALLALNQFNKLENILNHQKEIANFYQENLKNLNFILPNSDPQRIYMRYSVLLKSQDPDKILKRARRQNIFLDDGWRKTAIVPPDSNQEKLGYQINSCPHAEIVAKKILNLPTHINISKEDAGKIVDLLKKDGN